MLSLGIDVGELRNGLHLVLLDEQLKCTEVVRVHQVNRAVDFCRAHKPAIVAIDSPPAWGLQGNSRLAERQLRERGIQSFLTPNKNNIVKHENPFYGWMRVGFSMFDQLDPLFPRYRADDPKGKAIEVFPNASAIYIANLLRPKTVSVVKWRRQVLAASGVEVERLTNLDFVDAGLAALTGLFALKGDYTPFGDPDEGVIVVPRKSSKVTMLQKRLHAPR